jgi:hypothetical protein
MPRPAARSWRRLTLGLATLFGVEPKGWFIPYRHAASLPPPGARAAYAFAEALFRDGENDFHRLIATIEGHGPALIAIAADAPAPDARWNQDWFPRLDAAALYALMRARRPSQVIEIGSGHSTRFMVRAALDGGFQTRITAIDPKPRAALHGLRLNWIGEPLHAAGDQPFAALRAGDILFVDSSHVLMPGSDVDQILGRILPMLPAGVLIHFHDIFLPDDYPEEWVWRGYSEQLGLLALLQGGGFAPLFASHYALTRMRDDVMRGVIGRLPLIPGAIESSLWLEKR